MSTATTTDAAAKAKEIRDAAGDLADAIATFRNVVGHVAVHVTMCGRTDDVFDALQLDDVSHREMCAGEIYRRGYLAADGDKWTVSTSSRPGRIVTTIKVVEGAACQVRARERPQPVRGAADGA